MSSKRLVMCSSTSSLEYAPERYRNLGIELIRVIVVFEGKEYHEGLDLSPYDFFKRLETIEDPRSNLPHSANPVLSEIAEKYQSAIDRGYDEIIVVTLGSTLGGTYNSIKLVREDFKDKIKITIIDSGIAGFGEGMLAAQVADLVKKDVPTETIVKELEWSKAHQEFIGVCGKLDYLVYNGRLKGGQAFIGKALSICPVLDFTHDGRLETFAKVMSQRKANERMCEELLKRIGNRKSEDYYLWHNFSGEHSADMLKEIEKKYGIICNHEDVIGSPVIGCHTGPYLAGYGLFFKRREDEPLS